VLGSVFQGDGAKIRNYGDGPLVPDGGRGSWVILKVALSVEDISCERVLGKRRSVVATVGVGNTSLDGLEEVVGSIGKEVQGVERGE